MEWPKLWLLDPVDHVPNDVWAKLTHVKTKTGVESRIDGVIAFVTPYADKWLTERAVNNGWISEASFERLEAMGALR